MCNLQGEGCGWERRTRDLRLERLHHPQSLLSLLSLSALDVSVSVIQRSMQRGTRRTLRKTISMSGASRCLDSQSHYNSPNEMGVNLLSECLPSWLPSLFFLPLPFDPLTDYLFLPSEANLTPGTTKICLYSIWLILFCSFFSQRNHCNLCSYGLIIYPRLTSNLLYMQSISFVDEEKKILSVTWFSDTKRFLVPLYNSPSLSLFRSVSSNLINERLESHLTQRMRGCNF